MRLPSVRRSPAVGSGGGGRRASRHRRGCHNQAMAGAEVRRWEAARGGGAGRRRGGATSLVRGVGVGAVGEAAT